MYLKLHDLHWKVKSKMLVRIHQDTEARYDDMAEKFDEIAELIIMKGETLWLPSGSTWSWLPFRRSMRQAAMRNCGS